MNEETYHTETEQDNGQHKTFFTQLEARVLACLMEKQLTTPNNYPLTQNSLLLACNQKSNRQPVMNLTQGQVGHTVNQLERRNLVRIDYTGRASHVAHCATNALELNKKKQAVLTILMLREPLTLNDIKARTARMVDFEDANEVHEIVQQLVEADMPKVVQLPKSHGSRENRYTHVLCGEVKIEEEQTPVIAKGRVNITKQKKLEDRIVALEQKVEKLMRLLED